MPEDLCRYFKKIRGGYILSGLLNEMGLFLMAVEVFLQPSFYPRKSHPESTLWFRLLLINKESNHRMNQ